MFNGYYDKKTVNEGEEKKEFSDDFMKEIAKRTLEEIAKKKEIVKAAVYGAGTLIIEPIVKTAMSKVILPAINIAAPVLAVTGAVCLVAGAFYVVGRLFNIV